MAPQPPAHPVEWPLCAHRPCQNRVDPRRVAAGHAGCVELHPTPLSMPTTVPLPKSATVVGSREDLLGIASSHKTGVVKGGAQDFSGYANMRPRTVSRPRLPDVRPLLVERLRNSRPAAGGVYIAGDRVLGLAHRLSLVTSAAEPARLTPKGLLAREMILRGNVPEYLQGD